MSRQIQCERCDKIFNCNSENIEICQCRKVSLSQQQRDELAEKYLDCLCQDCLLAVKQKCD